jgi:tRNA dimethylallyltransferase
MATLNTHIITLGGQTSSGKSEMAVDLAKKLGDCWIINMDSRQIYKKLDLGTGKVPGIWQNFEYEDTTRSAFFYSGIPHFLIDVVDPSKPLTLVDVLELFIEFSTKPLPKYLILTGGTGLYIKAIVEKYNLVKLENPEEIAHIESLKSHLQLTSIADLQTIFLTYHAPTPNNSEYHNPQRLINTILNLEIKTRSFGTLLHIPQFASYQQFAIRVDQETLKQRISTRIHDRIKSGMIEEIASLSYLGHQRLHDLGLEYRYTNEYLQQNLTKSEFINTLTTKTIQYAKRQLTWLNAQQVIWIDSIEVLLEKIST